MTSPPSSSPSESSMSPAMLMTYTALPSRALDEPVATVTTRRKRSSSALNAPTPVTTIPGAHVLRAPDDVPAPAAKRPLFYGTAPVPVPTAMVTPYQGACAPPPRGGQHAGSPPAFDFTPGVLQMLNFRQSYLPMYISDLFGQIFRHAGKYDGLLGFVQNTAQAWTLRPNKMQPLSIAASFMYLASCYDYSKYMLFFSKYCVKRPKDIPAYDQFATHLKRVFRYTRAQLVVTKNPRMIDSVLTGAVHSLDIDTAVGALKVNPHFTKCGDDRCNTSMCVNPLCILVEACKRHCALDVFECPHEEMRLLLNLFFD